MIIPIAAYTNIKIFSPVFGLPVPVILKNSLETILVNADVILLKVPVPNVRLI